MFFCRALGVEGWFLYVLEGFLRVDLWCDWKSFYAQTSKSRSDFLCKANQPGDTIDMNRHSWRKVLQRLMLESWIGLELVLRNIFCIPAVLCERCFNKPTNRLSIDIYRYITHL